MKNMDVYKQNGYENRMDYLKEMADEFNIPYSVVCSVADILGADEDFDGLISELEELEEMYI